MVPFLRSLRPGAWPFCFVMCLLLAGCGGGGGKPQNSGGSPGDTISPSQRKAVLAATENVCEELSKQNLSPDAFDQALKTAMQANPAYKNVGVDPDSHTVFGVFHDGRVHMVANLPKPEKTGGGASFAGSRSVYLPGSKKAQVLHSFGANFAGQEAVNDVSGWLGANGYSVVPGAEGDASLSVLRNVKDLGYFYINTHGGSTDVPNSEVRTYSIQSSTLENDDLEETAQMKDDFGNNRLTYMTARNGDTILGGLIDDWDTRYGITANFVEKYWSFSPNSVVWINACYSGKTEFATNAGSFIFACHKKGAGVYLGWSKLLGSESAFHSVRYFTDRLLGANEFEKESPEQRPFAWNEVIADMQKKGHTHDNFTGADLVAFPRPGGSTPQILAPTIERMLVDESRERLILLGGFGTKQGTAKINGTNVDVLEWTNEKVELELARNGAASSGPVELTVDDHRSNVRNLTSWQIDFPFEYWQDEMPALKVTGPVKVRFRGDVGAYRLKPGEAPITHMLWSAATQDATADLTARGTVTEGDSSVTWSGHQIYVASEAGDPPTTLIARLAVDPQTRQGKLALVLGAESDAGLFTSTMRTPEQTVKHPFAVLFGMLDGAADHQSPIEGSGIPTIQLPSVSVTFNADWTLQSKKVEDPLGARFTIPAVVPSFPPASTAARSRR